MKKYLAITLPLLFLFSVSLANAEQDIKIELLYPNGDRATVNHAELVIESVDGTIRQTFTGNNSEHSFFATLDISKDYRMKVFMHDMLVSTKMVYQDDFENNVITINIPTSVGVKFIINYNDGKPITDATLDLYSHNQNLIRSSNTDSQGQTLRFWISPAESENNYYTPVVSINDEIKYTDQNLRLISGSTDVEIITPWPSSVDFLDITAKKDSVTTMNSWDDEYTAKLSNDDFEKSMFFNRGEAHFVNLPLGTFNLVIFEQDNPKLLWANSTIVVSEKSNDVDVIVTEPIIPNNIESTTSKNTEHAPVSKYPPEPNLAFVKQSVSGIQLFDDSMPYLKLTTDGDNSPVFTRSSEINQDLSNKNFIAEISVDNPDNVQELWFSFTSDNFESGWYTYAVPPGLISKEMTKISITSDDLALTGTQTLSSIDRVQIRLRDDGTSTIIFQTSNFSFSGNNQTSQSCNCVAFRLDDIQDFFLTDIQMELVETFQNNDVDLTIRVIANNIGKDIEITEFVKNISDDPRIEIANHGWDHETEVIGDNANRTRFVGLSADSTFNNAQKNISEYGFAIIPLHPKEFAQFYNNQYQNQVNFQQIEQLELLFAKLAENNIDIVFISEINPESDENQVPEWVKNNAQWWIEEKVSTDEFVDSLEFLIIQKIILVPQTESTSQLTSIPEWVKTSIKWWTEKQVSDSEFISATQFMIRNGIIRI